MSAPLAPQPAPYVQHLNWPPFSLVFPQSPVPAIVPCPLHSFSPQLTSLPAPLSCKLALPDSDLLPPPSRSPTCPGCASSTHPCPQPSPAQMRRRASGRAPHWRCLTARRMAWSPGLGSCLGRQVGWGTWPSTLALTLAVSVPCPHPARPTDPAATPPSRACVCMFASVCVLWGCLWLSLCVCVYLLCSAYGHLHEVCQVCVSLCAMSVCRSGCEQVCRGCVCTGTGRCMCASGCVRR